jgi:solute carrier family 25 carnitine/acylcarnitine transporter 20/29
MFVTQLREIRGYGAQFPAYEAVKDLLVWFKGSSGPSNFDLLISGGLAGVACWTASFP